VLPFNQPTDLYVELRLQLSSGFLTKRLPAPVSAYDQDVSAPGLGPFTVNQIDLSGVVNFNDLTSLGLTTIYDAWVEVYANGGIPGILGGASVNLEDGSWSLSLVTEEASLPARIVLVVDIGGGGAYIYDEIQTTLTGNRSDLDFRPGEVISAGTTINGTSIGNGYGYLFVPDTSGDYAFTLSGAGFNQTYISLSDNMGYYLGDTYGYPDAALSQFLTAGAVYYIWLDLYAPYRDFQFRVDPVSQATLGGTVDFSGILSSFAGTGVTVNYADIAVYADNSLHTPIGMAAINTGDGSWSAIVDMAGSSVPALFVITVNLSNGNTVNFQEQRSISGSNSGLTFNSGAVTVGSTVSRTTVNHYDWLLFVSTVTGDYSLKINGGAVGNRSLDLYDGETGSHLVGFGGEGELEIIRTLNAGTPYLIRVFSNYFSFESYQFRAEELQPATLSGTVSLSGLAVLPSTDINSTEIQVYAGGSSPAFLGSTMADSGGSWSLAVPASGTQAVRIVAYIHLNSGLWISAQRQDTISGNTDDLDLAPTAVSLAGGQALVRTGGAWEDLFLFVPASGGFFNLTAISGGGYTPWLTLYDTAGALLAQGSGSVYAELSAGTPYIVRVENIGSFAAYQFQLSSPITSTSIGGAVDYTGLPSSISSIISSAKVSAYLDNPAHTPIISGVSVESGGWSALIPANFIGQAARLTLTLSLSNGLMINSHIQVVLTASGLNFSPTGIPSGTVLNGKSAANGDDRFLFVPASSGTFTLQAGSDTGIYLYVYDEVAGLYIATSFGYYSTTLEVALVAGNPYVIEVFLSGNTFYDYQFYAGPPPTFGGTVDFSGLSSWNTDSAGILVFYPFDNDYNILATETVSLPGGLWSISGPAPTEDVFVALIARSTGGEGVLRIQTVVRTIGNTVIDFSPGNLDKNVASGVWHNRNASDSRGEWLLWIPDDDGDYVLDAEKTDGSMDPVMYLYDGLTGNLIAYNDDGGDNNNSRIQRSDFAAGYPYLVRVRAFGNNSGTFRFRAEEVSP
jgi:hypothetical protein